ncbi:MAG: methyltransferase domain-containing protein [Patescibacteria group bacterium]|jgi:tRNA G10  N-methylase Trm11
MLYYFILGQSSKLSVAEICAYLQRAGIDFKINKFSDEVLVLETKKEIDAEKTLDCLGGTIKIGQILLDSPSIKISPELVTSKLKVSTTDSKFHFGFSTYQLVKYNFRLPRNFGLEVKRLLKQKGISSRLVTSNEPNLSSVTVAKNRLLKNGAEICLIIDKDKVYIGQTLAVQKFGEYSRLDYGRPGRDSLSGMLPPKVAKMMVNIAAIESSKAKILDPFCGSGTVLQEAALLGYTDLIGSDISTKAIEDTKKNWEFLTASSSSVVDSHLDIHVLDATRLFLKIKPGSVDTIVTEPFLGPPLRGGESLREIKEITDKLAALYFKSFGEFKKVLKPGAKVVIIFPIVKSRPSIGNDQLEQIKKLGFTSDWDLPKGVESILTERQSIIYSRPGQRVEREIFVFKLK